MSEETKLEDLQNQVQVIIPEYKTTLNTNSPEEFKIAKKLKNIFNKLNELTTTMKVEGPNESKVIKVTPKLYIYKEKTKILGIKYHLLDKQETKKIVNQFREGTQEEVQKEVLEKKKEVQKEKIEEVQKEVKKEVKETQQEVEVQRNNLDSDLKKRVQNIMPKYETLKNAIKDREESYLSITFNGVEKEIKEIFDKLDKLETTIKMKNPEGNIIIKISPDLYILKIENKYKLLNKEKTKKIIQLSINEKVAIIEKITKENQEAQKILDLIK